MEVGKFYSHSKMKIEDFIVGNYYEKIYPNGESYIFKLKDINLFDLFHEWYINKDKYHCLNIAQYFYYDNGCNFREVCLTEFIHLLPSNHPEIILFRKKRLNKLLNI